MRGLLYRPLPEFGLGLEWDGHGRVSLVDGNGDVLEEREARDLRHASEMMDRIRDELQESATAMG